MEVLGQLALLAWIPLSAYAFSKFKPSVAALGVYLGALMFLPERINFDPQGFIRFDKESIPLICILVGLYMKSPKRLFRSGWSYGEILILIMLIGAVGTVFTNMDKLVIARTVKTALTTKYLVSMTQGILIKFWLPFFIGRILFRDTDDLVDLMKLLVLAGLVYSLCCVVEMRLSPHLHKWTYGFHQNPIRRSYRLGGYRPMCYMASGLALAVFMAGVAMAAVACWRARVSFWDIPPKFTAGFLTIVLLMCRSGNGIFYGTIFLSLIAFARIRTQALAALLLAIMVFSYPLLRLNGLFPQDTLIATATAIHPVRGDSLAFRLNQELVLMEKARERYLFGWGGHGRNRVYEEEKGRDISVTDGFWIICVGQRGMVGLVAVFGLLLFPVISMYRALPRIRRVRDRYLIVALSFIVISRGFDILPNGWYASLPLFLSGALLGLSQGLTREEREVPDARGDEDLEPSVPEATPTTRNHLDASNARSRRSEPRP